MGRTPFPGNILPASRLNPIALNYLKYYPLPNTLGSANGVNNFGITVADSDGYDNEFGRLDVNLSSKSRLSYDFRHSYRLQNKNNYFSNPAFGDLLSRANWGTTIDEIYTINPTMVLDVRASWTRFHEANASPGDGVDPASLGFPSSLAAASQFVGLPYMQFAGGCGANSSGFQCIGMTGDNSTPYDVYALFGSVAKFTGNHSLKFGADLRGFRESLFAHGNSDGSFSYNSNWITGPLNNNAAPPFGGDFAAFLLGLPTSGSFDLNTHASEKANYYSFYAQDDWRVRSRLTVNLGVRWEHETPTVERYNRAVNGFNPTAVNPISAAAAAAYAANPVPLVPVSQFTALGGLTFASSKNPNVYNTGFGIFSPRVGLAWTPAFLGRKTVLRGGFGMFVAPTDINGSQNLNQEGFSQTTQFAATSNNYLTPASTLSNPFPNGIVQPSANNGPGTFLGQALTLFNPSVRNSYSVRWNLGIQREIPGQIVLEVAYIGNHAVHLPLTKQFDYIPRQYLSPSLYRAAADSATISLLGGAVKNPFQGLLPNSSNLNGSTVALSQLLLPFPQFSGISQQYTNAGESYFNSLNIRAVKRFTHGLTMIQNFTYSKLIERVSYLNDSDQAPEKRVGADSRPLRETLAASYTLPIGRGRRFDPGNRIVNAVVGGWAANGSIVFQSGPPLSFGNVVYLGGPLHLNPHNPDGPTFDTTQFFTASNLQPASNIRVFHSLFNNLRRDPTKNADLSMLKRFTLGERKFLQVRFEGFNITNRVTFAAPSLSATSTAFATITAQANTPRRIQMGLRLVW